jgi:hypothetical protein
MAAPNSGDVLRQRGSRRNLTFGEKLAILRKKEEEPSWPQRVLAIWAKETFRLDTKPTQATISNLLRDKDRLLGSGAPPEYRALRRVKHPELDQRLADWAHDRLEGGVRVTNNNIRDKAVELAREMQLPPDMLFSKGWAACFMTRHQIPLPGRVTKAERGQEAAALQAVESEQHREEDQEVVQEADDEEEQEGEEEADNSVEVEGVEEEQVDEVAPPSTSLVTEDPSPRPSAKRRRVDAPRNDGGVREQSERRQETTPVTVDLPPRQSVVRRRLDTSRNGRVPLEPTGHRDTNSLLAPVVLDNASSRSSEIQRDVDSATTESGAWESLGQRGETAPLPASFEMTKSSSRHSVTRGRTANSVQEGRAATDLLLDWLVVPGSYSRWWLLKSDAEKEPLCDEINLFLRSHGLRGMSSDEIRMHLTTFVTMFQAAHTWLRQARVAYPSSSEQLTLEQESIKSHVRHMCPHYDKLVGVLAAYVDYEGSTAATPRKDPPTREEATGETRSGDAAIVSHAHVASSVIATPPKRGDTPPNPSKNSRRQGTESITGDSVDDEAKAQKRRLFELECERLQSEIETRNIQLVLEKTLARKKLLNAGISIEEVNQIFPL